MALRIPRPQLEGVYGLRLPRPPPSDDPNRPPTPQAGPCARLCSLAARASGPLLADCRLRLPNWPALAPLCSCALPRGGLHCAGPGVPAPPESAMEPNNGLV